MRALGARAQGGFLVRAEFLLFVNYEKPEIGKPHALRGKRMRADDQLSLAARESFFHLACFRALDETGKMRDLDSKPSEAAAKNIDVLAHEHGRGRDHRDLFAGEDCSGGR